MIRKWHDDGWRRRFALIPFVLDDGPERTLVWLEWYWSRFEGLYTAISLTDPRAQDKV